MIRKGMSRSTTGFTEYKILASKLDFLDIVISY